MLYQQILQSPSGSPTSASSVTCITQGLSGLSTNTGSITQGTPSSNGAAVPLDLRVQQSSPHHAVHLHHRSPASTPLQHSPSNSPSLGMIQEEHHEAVSKMRLRPFRQPPPIFSPHHPQISVTDELGGEVTLVACSSSSSNSSSDLARSDGDEMIVECSPSADTSAPFQTCQYLFDSTSNPDTSFFTPSSQSYNAPSNTVLPSFLISGPCDFSRPSIVRGIGKQQQVSKGEGEQPSQTANSEHSVDSAINSQLCFTDSRTSSPCSIEERRDAYAQNKNMALRHTFPPAYFFTAHARNIDYYSSEDSSSNDTENFQQVHRNHLEDSSIVYENGKNMDNAVSLSGSVLASDLLQKTSSGSFKLTLSDVCSQLNASDILGRIKRLIDERAPPKCFAFSHSEGGDSGDREEGGLALEYPGGVQIELRVCEDVGCELKGLKMRRISGDHLQYNQLCQELISCMTV